MNRLRQIVNEALSVSQVLPPDPEHKEQLKRVEPVSDHQSRITDVANRLHELIGPDANVRDVIDHHARVMTGGKPVFSKEHQEAANHLLRHALHELANKIV